MNIDNINRVPTYLPHFKVLYCLNFELLDATLLEECKYIFVVIRQMMGTRTEREEGKRMILSSAKDLLCKI